MNRPVAEELYKSDKFTVILSWRVASDFPERVDKM